MRRSMHPLVFESSKQRGGITILVALMLLGLLTVTVIGLSRGALRETMVLAAARQAADIREVADTGVEWSVVWMDPKAWPTEYSKGETSCNPLIWKAMQFIENPAWGGQVKDVPSDATAKMLLPPRTGEVSGIARKFDLQISYMGRLPITDTSQMDPRLFPLLWMLRSQGSITLPGGGMTFRHNREAWISTPLPEVR